MVDLSFGYSSEWRDSAIRCRPGNSDDANRLCPYQNISRSTAVYRGTFSSSRSPRTRVRISSRIGRTSSRDLPAGSSRAQSS